MPGSCQSKTWLGDAERVDDERGHGHVADAGAGLGRAGGLGAVGPNERVAHLHDVEVEVEISASEHDGFTEAEATKAAEQRQGAVLLGHGFGERQQFGKRQDFGFALGWGVSTGLDPHGGARDQSVVLGLGHDRCQHLVGVGAGVGVRSPYPLNHARTIGVVISVTGSSPNAGIRWRFRREA